MGGCFDYFKYETRRKQTKSEPNPNKTHPSVFMAVWINTQTQTKAKAVRKPGSLLPMTSEDSNYQFKMSILQHNHIGMIRK